MNAYFISSGNWYDPTSGPLFVSGLSIGEKKQFRGMYYYGIELDELLVLNNFYQFNANIYLGIRP